MCVSVSVCECELYFQSSQNIQGSTRTHKITKTDKAWFHGVVAGVAAAAALAGVGVSFGNSITKCKRM